MGYAVPTEVQRKVIPLILENRDVIVKSQTGSGKTAAFSIPLCDKVEIEEKSPQALVLVPTRELAVQVKEEITNIGRFKRIRCAAIFGKQPYDIQANELKQRVHIIVGTPGRTFDHIQRGNINTEKIKYLVIDEADEMLKLGFIDQVEDIIKALPSDRNSLLFSATIPDSLEALCGSYLVNPQIVEINSEKIVVDNIGQYRIDINEEDKFNVLTRVLYKENPDSCIFFCKTKENVDHLSEKMKSRGYSCTEIHGGMLQKERLEVIKSFKRGEYRYLVATDVAARGIDIDDVTHVINYDVPVEIERYVHRIGRTARKGKKGMAITLVQPYEQRLIKEIEDYIGTEIENRVPPSIDEVESLRDAFIAKNRAMPVIKEDKKKEVNKNIMKLHISAGKDKKIRPGDIVGAVVNIPGITAEDIGIIDIQQKFSFVEILNGKGKLVLDGLSNSKVKGKTIKVQKAKA